MAQRPITPREPGHEITPQSRALTEVPEATDWDRLDDKNQYRAQRRYAAIRPILQMMDGGLGHMAATDRYRRQIQHGEADEVAMEAALELGRSAGKPPSRATFAGWALRYQEDGLVGLADSYQGSQRKEHPWDARAIELIGNGNNVTDGGVAKMLQQEGYDAKDHQVRRLRISLPANITNRRNLGPREYRDRHKSYKLISWENLPPGSMYITDGSLYKIYLQHPRGTRPWRPEVTPILDVSTRYFVGFRVHEHESGYDTAHALANAIRAEQHVPIWFKSDGGSGFENYANTDPIHGFVNRLGINKRKSISYNPKGNGIVERYHGIVKEELLKGLPGYCGHDGSKELLKAFLKRCERGEQQMMTLAQFIDRLEEFRHWYNHERVHESLGTTPAAAWASIERMPVGDERLLDLWMRREATVRRAQIQWDNRFYRNYELEAYNGRRLPFEYLPDNGDLIRVLDPKGRWICDAYRAEIIDGAASCDLESRKQKSLEHKLKLIEAKAEEQRARAGKTLTHGEVLRNIEDFESPALADNSKEKGFVDESANPFHQPDQVPESGKDDWDWSDYI